MKVMRVREREILRGVACRRGLPLQDERCPLLSTMRVRWRVLRTCPDVSFFQTSRASAEMSVMFHKREQLRGGGGQQTAQGWVYEPPPLVGRGRPQRHEQGAAINAGIPGDHGATPLE